jgi:hypothetical protein
VGGAQRPPQGTYGSIAHLSTTSKRYLLGDGQTISFDINTHTDRHQGSVNNMDNFKIIYQYNVIWCRPFSGLRLVLGIAVLLTAADGYSN